MMSVKSLRSTPVAVALSILLAGCAVGPDYRASAPVSVPAQWTQAERANTPAALSLSRWWEKLNDPLLNSLVDDAITANPGVAGAAARVREARATYTQATGQYFPSLNVSGSAARSGQPSQATGQRTVSNQFQAGFDAGWEIDLFGGNRRAAEAAGYGVHAAEEDLRNTLLVLIGDIALNYTDLRGYQARLALAQDTARLQRQNAELTRTKFEAGVVSGLDLANAEGQASSAEAGIHTLQSSLAATLNRLSILLGQAPGTLQDRLGKPGVVPTPALPLPSGVPADILERRPDIRAAERRYAQATARIGVAEAARYPSISLTGRLATNALQAGDLGKNSTIGWSFGPSINLPLFRGGQLKAAADAAGAQRDQLLATYQSTVLSALEEVENTIVALSGEQRRQDKLTDSVRHYRQAASLSRELYEIGSISFIDVLVTERSLYASEDPLIQSQVNITRQYIALNKALGGGWDGDIQSVVTPGQQEQQP